MRSIRVRLARRRPARTGVVPCRLRRPGRTQLLRDLLALELDLRLEQGDVPDDHAYRQRFPGHDDVIDAVFGSRGKTDDPHPEQRLLKTEEPTVDGPVNDKLTIDTPGTSRRTEIIPGEGEP